MVVLFSFAAFLSAVLLFAVEPMLGKKVLPLLGGAPAVWNTCMLFFQSALLAGYAFAHGLSGVKPRRQWAAYLLVLAAGAAVLPIGLAASPPPPGSSPSLWLLGRLLRCAGLPFFALAAASPLLQKGLAKAHGRSARDPFYLYSASNVGSLGALLAYPALIEPAWTAARQARLWAAGYGFFFAAAAACGLAALRGRGSEPEKPEEKVRFSTKLGWLTFAFVPSSLMLGVTTHITANIAPMPLLWVLPLAVYLLTFILAFALRPPLSTATVARVLPFVLIPLALLSFMELKGLRWLLVPAHLLVLFVSAMLCHGRLAESRPGEPRLTSFYLWAAAGGALGGAFNALLAPVLFRGVSEYPLALVAVAALMPAADRRKGLAERLLDMGLPLALGIAGAWTVLALRKLQLPVGSPFAALAFGLLAVACLSFKPRPLRFAFGFAMLVWTYSLYSNLRTGKVLLVERDFYGVKRVLFDERTDMNQFIHGSTLHGVQSLEPGKRGEPYSYFGREGPVGDFFVSLEGRARNVGVVGLGIGTLAAYASPGRAFTFYELDPAVERIARDERFFSFLKDCGDRCRVVLGDGRLRLSESPDGGFDALILDVFGSEAMPAHFLTREAFALYDRKLAPGGVLLFNVSSRYLDLAPLLGALADDRGWSALAKVNVLPEEVEETTGRLSSYWVAVARSRADLAALGERGWKEPVRKQGLQPWTDDYTSLLPLVRWL